MVFPIVVHSVISPCSCLQGSALARVATTLAPLPSRPGCAGGCAARPSRGPRRTRRAAEVLPCYAPDAACAGRHAACRGAGRCRDGCCAAVAQGALCIPLRRAQWAPGESTLGKLQQEKEKSRGQEEEMKAKLGSRRIRLSLMLCAFVMFCVYSQIVLYTSILSTAAPWAIHPLDRLDLVYSSSTPVYTAVWHCLA